MTTKQLYTDYTSCLTKIADIKYSAAVLQWDQETYLPKAGAELRGQQLATLTEIAHELFTHEKLGILLNELSSKADLNAFEKKNVELSLYDYTKYKKLPTSFVRKQSEAVNKSFHAWIDARKQNNFTIFEKPLAEIIELKKQEADYLGYSKHPYNALMNDYDRGLTVEIADKVFEEVKPALLNLYHKIKSTPQVENSFLHQHFNKDEQWKFGLSVLKQLNFDFDKGRQDISEHPFTTNFNANDVRLTTRIDEQDFANMTWSCIHECGHGLYEQGLPTEQYGLPLGEYCSLSIHESQSRFWENNIGRGLPFWKYMYPQLQEIFPTQLSNISVEQFYKGINKVEPSLIRTEADELTYHFHVMIRYGIEKKLIEGSITSKDIPAIWNECYKNYLGLDVPNDKLGCLQDVHWSHGSFGYFATYSFGSLYAAQLHAAIKKEYTAIENDLELGITKPTLQWLRKNIHQHGRFYNSEDLCTNATGEPLNANYFIEYINKKYAAIYDLAF